MALFSLSKECKKCKFLNTCVHKELEPVAYTSTNQGEIQTLCLKDTREIHAKGKVYSDKKVYNGVEYEYKFTFDT